MNAINPGVASGGGSTRGAFCDPPSVVGRSGLAGRPTAHDFGAAAGRSIPLERWSERAQRVNASVRQETS